LVDFKRFFESYKYDKRIFHRWIFVSLLRSINWIVHILFLERITYFLEKWNETIFLNIIWTYLFYIILYEIISFSTKKWGWTEMLWTIWGIQNKIYINKFIQLDITATEIEWSWKLLSIIWQWIRHRWFMIWEVIENLAKLLVSIIFVIYMISKINILYWFIFLILFIIFASISLYFTDKLQSFRKKRNENLNDISRAYAKIIMSKMEIMRNWKTNQELNSMNKLFMKDIEINKDMAIYRQYMKRIPDFFISLLFIFSYLYLWHLFFLKEISFNVIVWVWSALILMQKSFSESLSFYIKFNKDFIVVEKLWDFFDNTPLVQWYEDGKDFEYKTGNIEIKNMTFSYLEWKKIFENFDLKIAWWKVLALIWNSWSWKSTLVKLISGYIKSNSWKIIIDWQDLSEVNLKSFYRNIWYLTQEPSVFDGTILENLMYGMSTENENIHSIQLKNIIFLAKCEFIYDLPKWIETEIWERWIRLSWWQRQRLAIAKIMLKDPKIIILDEPTSALDSFSEEQVSESLHNLFTWRTVIIIAHRLQTVKKADKILVLESWKIVEEWNHESLVIKDWIYKKMLDLQSGF